jgi:hypothetical protein
MHENARYSDEQVNQHIREFLDDGELMPIELFDRLTTAQQQRIVEALRREEFRLACKWQRAWEKGETTDIPPGGAWAWTPVIPDDPSDLTDGVA